MQLYSRLPRLIRWILSVYLSFLVVMTLFRSIFYWQFNPSGKAFSGSAFFMGLRFDIKFISILSLFILILCVFKFLNPFKKEKAKHFWNIFLPLVFVVTFIVYAIDYFHYDYLHQRLNANVLSYLGDASISATMAWQSYPVIKFLIALIILAMLARIFFVKKLNKFQQQEPASKRKGIVAYIIFFLLLGASIFGKFSQYPLRWSDAFTLSDDFKANLSLNPFQSFFSTLRFKDTKPDMKKVREEYALIASLLRVQNPDSVKLNYQRSFSFNDSFASKPNIVLVICESFSMYKSSMSGNPLNSTPFFNEMVKSGIFFDRCFSPSYGTARGVWATVTGIPDVLGTNKQTASRNPAAVDQKLIINDFKGYDKFYFLGGDPTWANIQGFLKNNIDGLKIYSQDDFNAKKEDVWGISDKNLFLSANKIIAKNKQPFFAIIQTADNHRPYTIPAEDIGPFQRTTVRQDSLEKYGFASNREFDAFRYTDFSFQQFIEAAKKEKYFDNTIFVFIGDHGIGGDAKDIYPRSWTEQRLVAEHVPLLFYAPKLLQPQRSSEVCSQIDVMSSIASLTKTSYSTSTLGQNLFDTLRGKYSFIVDQDRRNIGIVTNDYFFVKNLESNKEVFVSVKNNDPVAITAETERIKKDLSKLTEAYYQTAKYLILNNKKN
ncbi:LTA synthase family protein [Ferruginibacter sp. SUN002]|uniref:LTA synthase family protein n=1 Tax=Ferruginibacter sp. SUN002 TaxID=2937789 RepID=UPI003D36CE98